jgi:hypothetical protein
MLGRLVVSLGVSAGGYIPYAGKRGFHVIGVTSFECPFVQDWSRGTSYPGDCRANSFDGALHGDQHNVDVAHSISGQVASGLSALENMFPEEDWGYFLGDDGSVRWSSVIVIGSDYGSTTAARIATLVHVDRAIAETGISDNSCGSGAAPNWPAGGGTSPGAYYSSACVNFGGWLDGTPATPVDGFWSFIGRNDSRFGDAMFASDRLHLPGAPIDIDVASPPYGSHRFIHEGGHLAIVESSITTIQESQAVDVALGVPPENQNPNF